MARAGLMLAAAAVAAAMCAVAARAEVLHTTEYRSHSVSGTTPAAVWRSMNAHPIIDPDDGPAYANLTHDHSLAVKTATVGGVCRVTELRFRWTFVLTLPKAADYGRMSAGVRGLWDGFVASLRRHEEGHRTIFLKCGQAFTAAAAKMTGPAGCLGLDRRIRRYIDRQYDSCMLEQREYEKRDRPRVMASPFLKAAMGR